MVFQDGGGYKDFVPTVFDNLIAKKEMPVTVGVFIHPGHVRATAGANRSFEYDTLSDQYARFLLEEILPEVEKTVKLRHDADEPRHRRASAAAASAPGPSPGSGPTSSARCSRGSAASPTSPAARPAARGATTTRP